MFALAAGAATGLDRVLELLAKRGRALIDAQSTVVMLRDGSKLVVAARADTRTRRAAGGCRSQALFWGR